MMTTDKDVADRVGGLWNVSVTAIENRDTRWKKAYAVRLRGKRAMLLMRQLRPMMGARRREAIDMAIASHVVIPHSYDKRKLSDSQVREIQRRLSVGETQSSIAKVFGVRGSTVSRNKDRKFAFC